MGRKKMGSTDATGGTSDMQSTETNSSDLNSSESTSRSAGATSRSAYWRKVLEDNPGLLKGRKNDKLYAIWMKDHPGHDKVPKDEMQILSNVKSQLRTARKTSRGKARAAAPAKASAAVSRPARISARNLEQLEIMLDDCIMLAMDSGKDELESVILNLRKARREVGIKLGL
jgi:hypothetical protein